MLRRRFILAGLALSGLAGCGAVGRLGGRGGGIPSNLSGADARGWHVVDVRVTVPESLTVSEANSYYPVADIVWRGEPYGDRRQQVARLIDEALTEGFSVFRGPRPVIVEVTMERFHALSEKARYSIGGVHSIRFVWTIRDARTGEVIYGPERVDASFRALGGQEALEAEHRGITQKVRIKAHLVEYVRRKFGGAVASAG